VSDDDACDAVVDRLIEALAAQVDFADSPTLAPGAAAALAGLSRAEVRLIFGAAGHRVHYDADTEPIANLIRLISDVQRAALDADAAIRPGDEVHLVRDRLPDQPSNDVLWWDDVVYVVRYVGDDDTVDVQPELTMDYLVETVPAAALRPMPG
jgi:hypothetical protein